jgi:hypothetical protein
MLVVRVDVKYAQMDESLLLLLQSYAHNVLCSSPFTSIKHNTLVCMYIYIYIYIYIYMHSGSICTYRRYMCTLSSIHVQKMHVCVHDAYKLDHMHAHVS